MRTTTNRQTILALTIDSGLPIRPTKRSAGRRAAMIFRSPYPDIAIPDTAFTPFVLRHAERLADKAAIIDALTGDTLTYGQLAARVRTLAAALTERGFRKGDVFAISMLNGPEYAIVFHAVLSLGGIVTPVNPTLTSEELARQLSDAGATYFLTVPQCLERATTAMEHSPA